MDDTDTDMRAEGVTDARVRPDHDARAGADPVLYSAAVSGSASTLPQSGTSRSSRRLSGPARVVVIAGAAVVALWIPSFIATAYAEVPAGEYLANPAKGWAFLWESVTASRNPRLGTADAALQEATQVWAGQPAVDRRGAEGHSLALGRARARRWRGAGRGARHGDPIG